VYAEAYARTRDRPYGETFRCPGGELCLDFCNTGHGVRNSEGKEWIAGFDDLMDWLEAAGALTRAQAAALRETGEATPDAAKAVWKRALRFRAALSGVLLAKHDGQAPREEDLRELEAEYARSASCARLSVTAEGFSWSVEAERLDAALRPIVASAVGLLTSPRIGRVRRCGSPTCYWLFVDETKNCSRRWCEMASCGNLMKVRRHRARRRGD
jgi:predicted RNA-binding Zn ribbon-like protein